MLTLVELRAMPVTLSLFLNKVGRINNNDATIKIPARTQNKVIYGHHF